MAKKTVLRRLCKYLPSSADIEKLWESDGETYDLPSERDSARPDAIEADQFDNPAPQQDDAPKQTRAASRIAKKVQEEKADTKPAADDAIDVDVEDDDGVDYPLQQPPSGSRRGAAKSKSSQASNNFRKQESNKSPSGRSLLVGRNEAYNG